MKKITKMSEFVNELEKVAEKDNYESKRENFFEYYDNYINYLKSLEIDVDDKEKIIKFESKLHKMKNFNKKLDTFADILKEKYK